MGRKAAAEGKLFSDNPFASDDVARRKEWSAGFASHCAVAAHRKRRGRVRDLA